MRRLNNHVMYEAFSSVVITQGHPLLTVLVNALKRNKPAQFGGWRVINRRGRDVKRRR